MKKLLLIVVVLLMAAPLYAENEIRFSFVDNWDGSCTITYDVNEVAADPCDDPPVRPVAMGLVIEVTSGNPIKGATCEDPCNFFEIFMDAAYSIESDPCDPCGYQYGDGTPIADPCGPGEISLPQTKFSISMGGLGGETDPDEKQPPLSGTITLYADTQEPPAVAGDTVTGTIKLDAMRGGIIGEDGEPMVAIGLNDGPAKAGGPPWEISECFSSNAASYINWYGVGKEAGAQWSKPRCWCFNRQCRGDVNGAKVGPYWVQLTDLQAFKKAYIKANPALPPGNVASPTSGGICSDLNHIKVGPYHVQLTDLQIFKAHYIKAATLVPCCDNNQDCVLDGTDDYNFWTN